MGITVRWCKVPDCPITVTLKCPLGVVARVAIVIRDSATMALGVTLAGEIAQRAPCGKPEQERLTLEPNAPPTELTSMVRPADSPCLMLMLAGVADREKSTPVPLKI